MQDCFDEIIPNNRQGGRDTNFTKGHELGDGINAEAQRDGRSAKWFEDRARMENSTIPLTDPFLACHHYCPN